MSKHRSPSLTQRQAAVKYGWRSGLEERVGAQLTEAGMDFEYEETTLKYTVPARTARYTPDFSLSNGIVIETKGRFMVADRQKMVLVKEQHPDLDIRFVFTRSATTISKTSKTTYAAWCEKHGFPYADKLVPAHWLQEPPNKESLKALERIKNDG